MSSWYHDFGAIDTSQAAATVIGLPKLSIGRNQPEHHARPTQRVPIDAGGLHHRRERPWPRNNGGHTATKTACTARPRSRGAPQRGFP